MKIYEHKLIEILQADDEIISMLEAVQKLNLTDSWIAAGVIRNKVWDLLHGIKTLFNDVDIIYYDQTNLSLENEKKYESELRKILPDKPWSVKNQARMHLKSGFNAFDSSYDGVAHFPETPTAIAVRMIHDGIEVMAPYGLTDLFELKVKPTMYYKKDSEHYRVYLNRIKQKNWQSIWKKYL